MKTHNMTNSKLFKKWLMIRERCRANKYYTSKNITVCDEWRNNFKAFYDWAIANGYQDGLSIDRINNNGNYEPSNCRWVGMSIQARNTRVLRFTNTTGYRGVSKRIDRNKWQAIIKINSKQKHLGYFNTALQAAFAYDCYVVTNNLEHTTNFKIQNII